MDPTPFTGTIAVTLAYFAVYYGIMTYNIKVKVRLFAEYKARGEKFDRYFSQDREMLAADRYQLNMLEHMPPFITLLWMHAAFVSDTTAWIAGCVYLAARLAYPIVVGKRLGNAPRSRVYLVTFSSYAVLAYFLGSVLWQIV